uniref:Uncharacterized protein n=1 Tax=Glossina brevipalpis TaxID=37001 RepID=A0A1A9W5J1_9MUSC
MSYLNNLELHHILKPHPSTCICIEFHLASKYFATGSADALVSLWDANELACLRRTLLIDIAHTETSEKVTDIPVDAAIFIVRWHPKQYLLAYACGDKNNNNDRRREAGNLKVYELQE